MQVETIIAGFGGQGALFAGQLLAYAALDSGMHVTWIPSYGPEMRGGTAHCTVVVSDQEIGSPLVRFPGCVLALNQPSLDKYEPLVKTGGILVYNASLVVRPPARSDLRAIGVPANDIAEELGNVRQANVVLLGALLAAGGFLPLEAAEKALENHLPERWRRFLESNKQALRRGAGCVAGPPEPVAVSGGPSRLAEEGR
jgi:2-oxoglutarate ferredoxin oxidoreductase subunit gamma